jgi:exosome complex RNA-binding protein Rrp4
LFITILSTVSSIFFSFSSSAMPPFLYKDRDNTDNRLMSPKFPLLPTLAAHIAFEICIGLNGKIWFKSTTISEGIALKRILEGVDSGELTLEKSAIERALRQYMA